jgi:catechol 2,3-dioxygenase
MPNGERTAVLPYGIQPPQFRLPDSANPGAVRLQVGDLERSLNYYQRVLGLRVLHSDVETASLAAHGDDRVLVALQAGAGVKRARRGALGLYHFAILLPDRASLGRFAAHAAALRVRVGMADHLVSEALYLWDPDDLGIEVYADRPRETWRHRDRELAMATDPLDIDSVIAAGGGTSWDGAPAGTTIGHVHLHVGGLDLAEAFYHRALGFDKMVWSYPGALFLAAGGYHHHLGTNVWAQGPAAAADEARLLEWEIVLPTEADVTAAAGSLAAAGHTPDATPHGIVVADPWGTRARVRAEG